MRQIILTQTGSLWCYMVLENGLPVASDYGYDNPADALDDATNCPTPIK